MTRQEMLTTNFLDQQNRLANGEPMQTKFGEVGKGTSIHDPIVVTRPWKNDLVRSELPPIPNVVIGEDCRIDSFSKLEGGDGLFIGDRVHVASFAHLNVGGGKLRIYEGAAIASGCVIVTGGNAPDAESCSAAEIPRRQILHKSEVVIGKNACLYAHVTVLPGVTIGEGARIAAGSVVTKDVPPFQMWRGSPAIYWRHRADVQVEHASGDPMSVTVAEKAS